MKKRERKRGKDRPGGKYIHLQIDQRGSCLSYRREQESKKAKTLWEAGSGRARPRQESGKCSARREAGT